ncbi:hypothetical protein AB0395_35030 [Streptosporangium sp. NPDC051023]|uniref:hypothetical protein n=1 Tax=Streptosporangium sp. NPDC051023 TaxID=3155410 RepID=UPI00344F4C74
MPKFSSALQLAEQTSPANPPAGWVSLFAKPGGALWARTSAGVERLVEPGILFPFSASGTLAVMIGSYRLYNDTGNALTIKAVRASVGTAPTGAPILVDINVDGSTIFATQANRPTIAIGTNTSGKVTAMSTTSIADGSYFSVDVDQVGSVVAGANLTVQVLC